MSGRGLSSSTKEVGSSRREERKETNGPTGEITSSFLLTMADVRIVLSARDTVVWVAYGKRNELKVLAVQPGG